MGHIAPRSIYPSKLCHMGNHHAVLPGTLPSKIDRSIDLEQRVIINYLGYKSYGLK